MCPKTSSADDVAAVRARCAGKPVLALIETAAGMAGLGAIAVAPGVARLVFGSIDFQLDMDIEDDDEALRPYRAQLVLASRVAGLPAPVDGVTTALGDAVALARDARRARASGFGGKLCIHPAQVAGVNAAFSPSPSNSHGRAASWRRRRPAGAPRWPSMGGWSTHRYSLGRAVCWPLPVPINVPGDSDMTEAARKPGVSGLYLVLVLNGFVAAAGLTVLYLMLATLYREYAGSPGVGWAVTSYLLVSAIAAALCGRLGDLLGRRFMVLVVLALASVGALASAFLPSLADWCWVARCRAWPVR